MKTVMELLRRPLVKIIGLILVIYFGLLSNKENPDSLGNRLSSEKIKEHIGEIHEKSTFILSNIDKAHQLSGVAPSEEVPQNLSAITVQDTEIGSGDSNLKCGDEAEISYDIHVLGSNNKLEFFPKEKIIIGSNVNSLLEHKIIGMKSGGTRIINIPRDFKSTNQKLAFLLKFNESALQYNVTLIKFGPANSDNLHCSINND